MKKILTLLMLVMAALIALPTSAKAATKNYALDYGLISYEGEVMTGYAGIDVAAFLPGDNVEAKLPIIPKSAKIIHLKVSNAKTASAKVYTITKDDPIFFLDRSVYGRQYVYVWLDNPGTATISFDIKKSSGTLHHVAFKVKAIGYKNPFKKFAIGSTNFTSRYRKSDGMQTDKDFIKKTYKGKLTITPSDKKVILGVRLNGKKIKLGQTITFNKKSMMEIVYADKDTKHIGVAFMCGSESAEQPYDHNGFVTFFVNVTKKAPYNGYSLW